MAHRTTERRKHKRHPLACPISVVNRQEQVVARGRTMDLSNGGAMFIVPIKSVPKLDQKVAVRFSVPRSTPNTYLLEEFAARAQVVRHQPMEDNETVGVAIQFQPPMSLGLDV